MNNGVHWEQRFGKSANEMDDGEYRIAVSSILCELLDCTKHVKSHHVMYTIIKWAVGPLFALLIWIVTKCAGITF